MVKKLFKHEFIYYLRSFGVFPLMLLIVSALVRIFLSIDTNNIVVTVLGTSSLIVFFISCFSMGLAALVASVVRFYQNLYTAEGYLTFTLPVTNDAHIFVKLVTAFCCQLVSYVTVFLSVFIAFIGTGFFSDMKIFFSDLADLIVSIGVAHSIFYALEILIFTLLSWIMSMLLFYGCITVGQTAKKNRVFTAIAAYFVCYLATQVLSTAITIIFTRGLLSGIFDGLFAWIFRHPYASAHIGFWLAILIVGGLGVAFWFIIRTIMSKKLNLE